MMQVLEFLTLFVVVFGAVAIAWMISGAVDRKPSAAELDEYDHDNNERLMR